MLRPSGQLGVVWHARDGRLLWVSELSQTIGHDGDPVCNEVTLPAPFTDMECYQVKWTSYLAPQALINLVASHS